jgi:hypothetical protein
VTNVDVSALGTKPVTAPGPVRRVKVSWLAAAVGAAVVAAVLVLWALGQVGDRRDVVMVVEAVPAGETIPASALSSTGVAIDSDATQLFGADQIGDLVGRTAAVSLAPGDLVGPSMIRATSAVPDGWVEVGAVLRATHYPATVQTGDTLWAVPTGDAAIEGDVGRVEVLVVGYERSSDRNQLTVLAVDASEADLVARWAAASQLVLVRVTP